MTIKNPRVGTIVDYFNPALILKVGRIEGYGGRGVGPYAAVVTNDRGIGLTLSIFLPDMDHPIEQKAVPYEDEVSLLGKDKGYWQFQTPIEKARAAK